MCYFWHFFKNFCFRPMKRLFLNTCDFRAYPLTPLCPLYHHQTILNSQEFSRKYITPFCYTKTVVCSIFSKKLKLYERKLQQRDLNLQKQPFADLDNKVSTVQQMKFSSKDLVTFTEKILNEKLHFLCSDSNLTYGSQAYQRQWSAGQCLVILIKSFKVLSENQINMMLYWCLNSLSLLFYTSKRYCLIKKLKFIFSRLLGKLDDSGI